MLEERTSGLHHLLLPVSPSARSASESLFLGSGALLFRLAIGSAVCTVVCTALGIFGIIPEHSRTRTPLLGMRALKCSGALFLGLQNTPEIERRSTGGGS